MAGVRLREGRREDPMRHVPLCRISTGPEEIEHISKALASGDISSGEYNALFEERMCRALGVPCGVATSSGYGALHAAIHCLKITGDVVVPSFTFAASVNAIVRAGANPVFADVAHSTRNMTAAEILAALTPKTQAIMVVHFAGQVCEMGPIEQIARARGLHLIEDSAQTLGARYRGRAAGSFGVGCFSFFATKNITTGEGGFCATHDPALRDSIRRFIGHGVERDREKPWYRDASEPGMNFRMSNLHAAVGYAQLGRLERMNSRRRQIAAEYHSRLQPVCGVELPATAPGCEHTWQMYTICVDGRIRDGLVAGLRQMGVMASVHFAPAVHRQTAYRDLTGTVTLPVTENLSRTIVSLPIYPDMDTEDVSYVCDSVEQCLKQTGKISA